ncbi:MAG: PorP/SprF family type IX secretion system membrane protein [Chitinophagaceae bacterium]|jgi:type IX secretion system PorP/SprF family membrane protein|nr:PorP/SprF family type IX secretion system membrane protein [Chitinophagaceae bacterium]
MRYFFGLVVVFFLCEPVQAQDPHFSQFFASPLTLNPGYTGKFNGTFRVAGNYRNQWPTINNAFTTATASVDFPILTNVLPVNDVWGVGIMGLNDRSGNKILNNNFLTLSTAYHKGLDENGYHQITVGFQGSFASKRLDISRADFQDELTSLGFTGVTSEIFNNQQVVVDYFDLNTGIMYYGTTNGTNNFYAGVSVYHVNRPAESFQGGSFVLDPRVTIHGGGYFPVGQYKTFHGSVLHQRQAGANETVLGGAMAFNVNYSDENPIELYTGLWYRFNDAFIPYVGMDISGFRLGFSYDINNSSLNTASNGRGGTEISLIYIARPVDPNMKKLNCPKF